MRENEIAKDVVNACYEIHRELGSGLFESVYEEVLWDILLEIGYSIKRQVPVPIVFRGKEYGLGFRADFIIEDTILVELKSVEKLTAVHFKQAMTYLKLLDLRLGLLINFNVGNIGEGIKRIANNL